MTKRVAGGIVERYELLRDKLAATRPRIDALLAAKWPDLQHMRYSEGTLHLYYIGLSVQWDAGTETAHIQDGNASARRVAMPLLFVESRMAIGRRAFQHV